MSIPYAIRTTAAGRLLDLEGRVKAGLDDAAAGVEADAIWQERLRPFLVAAFTGAANADGLSFVSMVEDRAFALACIEVMEGLDGKSRGFMKAQKGIWVPPNVFSAARARLEARQGAGGRVGA